MVEKFSDYEGSQFLDKEGEFVFEIMSYELSESKAGYTMAVFEVKSEAGGTKLYHSLNPKARWSYNGLIKACMKLDTPEKIAAFQCDYELIGRDLVGKKFIGVVECETYKKEVKRPNDDGTFTDDVEVRESYKVKSYKMA
jgi:hypothetical protein